MVLQKYKNSLVECQFWFFYSLILPIDNCKLQTKNLHKQESQEYFWSRPQFRDIKLKEQGNHENAWEITVF